MFAPGFIDNYLGKVDAGISDAYSTQMSDSASSGVLMHINIPNPQLRQQCPRSHSRNPRNSVNDALPAQVITPAPILTGATYSWTPAAATGPVAVSNH